MVQDIAYALFLGKPLIMYGGILAYLLLLATAAVGALNHRGIRTIPFNWHPRLAVSAILAATIHAVFGLSAYFGF